MAGSSSQDLTTVAAELTAVGRGAVATIGVFGPQAWRCVQSCFQTLKSSRPLKPGQVRYGVWSRDLETNAEGEGLVVSVQSHLEIEIHCHGGTAAVHRILDDLHLQGAKRVTAWEYIAATGIRPLELACAHVVSQTRTELTAGYAMAQFRGTLRAAVDCIRDAIVVRQIDQARELIVDLIATARIGMHLSRPWEVAIVGPPNVGKSSLLNALVGWQRAITSETPGTTRDVVGIEIAAEGWPIRLLDTAGLRGSENEIEKSGIQRMLQASATADLTLLVVDAEIGWTAAHEVLKRTSQESLIVWNKVDLPGALVAEAKAVTVSAATAEGIPQLLSLMIKRLVPDFPVKAAMLISPELLGMVSQLQRRLDHGEVESALADLASW